MRLGSDRSADERGGSKAVATIPTAGVETDGCSAGGTNGGDAPLDSVRRQQQPACRLSSPQALATWQGIGAASAIGAQRTCKPLQAKASSRTKDAVTGRKFFISNQSLGSRPSTQIDYGPNKEVSTELAQEQNSLLRHHLAHAALVHHFVLALRHIHIPHGQFAHRHQRLRLQEQLVERLLGRLAGGVQDDCAVSDG